MIQIMHIKNKTIINLTKFYTMKKVYFIVMLLSIFVLGNAQVDTISTNIYQKNGNLGIGITQPETKLRIEGDVSDGNNRSFIRLRNTNTGNKSSVSIAVESNDKQNGAAFGYTSNSFTAISDFNNMGVISCNGNGFSIYSTTDYGSLRFYTNKDQNGIIERMRINAEGNIGIGIRDPKTILDINGGIRISNSTDQYAGILRWTGSDFEGYNGNTWMSLTGGSSDAWQSIWE